MSGGIATVLVSLVLTSALIGQTPVESTNQGAFRSYKDAQYFFPSSNPGGSISFSTAVPPSSSARSQTVIGVQGQADAATRYFNSVYRFNAFNEKAAQSIQGVYEIGSEGNYLDNSTFSTYRLYAWDFINHQTIWFIDNSHPNTFVFPAPIDVFVERDVTVRGRVNAGGLHYSQLCRNAASPAECGSAASGAAAIPAGKKTLTVNTSAVTADSVILVTADSSLSATLRAQCNMSPRTVSVVARSPGQSFTVATANAPGTSSICFSYAIHN